MWLNELDEATALIIHCPFNAANVLIGERELLNLLLIFAVNVARHGVSLHDSHPGTYWQRPDDGQLHGSLCRNLSQSGSSHTTTCVCVSLRKGGLIMWLRWSGGAVVVIQGRMITTQHRHPLLPISSCHSANQLPPVWNDMWERLVPAKVNRTESFHVSGRGVGLRASVCVWRSEELLVFTSPVLMVTNFFAIIKNLFYFDCSLGHGRS